MKNIFLSLMLLLAGAASLEAAGSRNNVAYQDEHVRFTVISDGALRLEWSADGQFVDQASFVAVERQYDPVAVKVKKNKKQVVISTSQMELTYTRSSAPLSADNLKIASAKGAKVPFCWHPGDKQEGNLQGTYRTLDRCDGELLYGFNRQTRTRDTTKLELEPGLLATCGWTLIDDSRNFLFTDEPEPWVMERKDSTAQDWYFLAYGHNYKQALRDFTRFAGRIPMPPRYAFGYWWSRYWAYTDQDLKELIQHFEALDIPMDVLVIDMDWHYSDNKRGGWTGYNWNRDLIKDPDALLRYIHEHGVRTTLNLHPADGIKRWEETFPAVAAALGVPDTADIPWQGSNKLFMDTWMEKVLRPLEKQGVDFWWLDWQQFPNDRVLTNLSNTWWLNYYIFTDMARNRNVRPMLYHRWGGLGNHRYQIGFSGDSYSTWRALKYQPYFNSTASNVLYGYWSHDLGGHMLRSKNDSLDQELYVRWMQFGAFSPIMRTHSTNDRRMTKEPWVQRPENQRVLEETIRLRYKLVPYIYTMAREAYDTGVSLCRPLYYDYPEAAEAYAEEWRSEYMFGDNLLIAPIVEPMHDGLSTLKIWLPEGVWYDFFKGDKLEGGRVIERSYKLDEYPVFVKAGTILPLYKEARNLNNQDTEMEVLLFPGEATDFVLYEDKGDTQDYAENFWLTKMHYDGKETLTTKLLPCVNMGEIVPARKWTSRVFGK